jgi:hypothetical protein
MSRSRPLLLAGALLLLSACDEAVLGPTPHGPAGPPGPAPVTLAQIHCQGDLRTRRVDCGGAPKSGVSRLIVGGQGERVRVETSAITILDAADLAVRDTFRFQMLLRNLIAQPLGTRDGETLDSAAVRLLFNSGPTTTSGTGSIEVANPDGVGTFTAAGQPFFQFNQVLATDSPSVSRLVKLAFDPGVATFEFTLFASAAVLFPNGWVDVSPSALTLPAGGSAPLSVTVHDVYGVPLSESYSFGADPGDVASVDGGGNATALCTGSTQVGATTATRPARQRARVTVQAPSQLGWSPDPFGGSGSALSRTASIEALLSGTLCASSSARFVVHTSQSKLATLGGSFSGGGTSTLSFLHTQPLFAGETVEVTAPRSLTTNPSVVRFRVAPDAAAGTFPTGPLSTGSQPEAIVATDLDGDGLRDLAIANRSGNSLTLYYHSPSINVFLPPVTLAVAGGPIGLAAADFNADGRQDLAVSRSTAGAVSVLYRNASGGYDLSNLFVIPGSNPWHLAAGDVNGDARPDLVATTRTDSSLRVMRRLADNSGFDAPQRLKVGVDPWSVAIADLQGDGRADLLSANNLSGDVSVLFGDLSPEGWAPPLSVLPGGSNPRWVVAQDLNGDGHTDLAVAQAGSANLALLRGNAAGTGWEAPVSYAVGSSPGFVAAADLDGDGDTDLVVANGGSSTMNVLSNTANTGFSVSSAIALGFSPRFLAIGDLNGDGRVDVASANGNANTASLALRNAANNGYTSVDSWSTGSEPMGVAVGDFDGDGQPDLATANFSANSVTVLRRQGNGFSRQDYPTGLGPMGVAAADLDNDGHAELITAHELGNSVGIRRWLPGSNDFGPEVSYAVGSAPVSVAAGDLDGDGFQDLAVAHFGSNKVRVLRDPLEAVLPEAFDYDVGSGPFSVAIGDFNADGRLDFATANNTDNTLTVRIRTGGIDSLKTSSFLRQDLATGTGPRSVAAGDFDGDGAEDLVVGENSSGTVSVFMYSKASSLMLPGVGYAVSPFVNAVATGDVNGDGRLDVVTANGTGTVSVLLRNAGNTEFIPPFSYRAGSGPVALALGDLNGDRRLDVAVVSSSLNAAGMLWNVPPPPPPPP